MSIRSFLSNISKKLPGWVNIGESNGQGINGNVPSWVVAAKERWESNLERSPYDQEKVFVGKNFFYKVYFKAVSQGHIQEFYYRKRRTT